MAADPLSPEHRRVLEHESAIASEVIAARGYRTVSNKEELRVLGFSQPQCRVPGLLIPIYPPGGTNAGCQFRPDSPRTNKQGRVIKYEIPSGSGIRIDCPPPCHSQLADPSTPLWVTEGVKKGDSLAAQGLCAVALMGVWGFKGKNALGGTTVLADLDYVAWKERLVRIVFDSDVMTKPQVQQALERLTEHLRRRDASVRHIYLPAGPNGEKVGVDDFLAAGHSTQELEALAREPEDVPNEPLPLVLEQLPDAPVAHQARVPSPYRLKPDGLHIVAQAKDRKTEAENKRAILITPAALVVASRYQDVDTGEYDLELAWRTQGVWQRTTLRRDVVADHRKLPSAALHGLPVTSLNGKGITGYLASYEHINLDAIPKTLVTRRCGWREMGGKLGFVLGNRVIGPDSASALHTDTPAGGLMGEESLKLLADSGVSGLVKSLHSRGTVEGWLKAIKLVADFPRVMLGVYAALTPPLLHVLEALNFILDYCGGTSIGKTTSQHGAASVWGLPPGERGGLTVAWNSTQVFAERYAELMNDLPIIVEDSQTADPRTLIKTIYMLANGVGRGRGSPRGLRGVTRWHGVTISSGERPLYEVTQEGGAKARIITLWGSPFGSGDCGFLVRQFKAQIAEHYGHAGPIFVSWLLAHHDQWAEFRRSYKTLADTLTSKFTGNVGGRCASYFAAILVAGTLATPVLGLPGDAEETVQAVMEELADTQEEADTARSALVDFVGWATASQGQFEGKDMPEHPPHTYLGRWQDGEYIAVFTHRARMQLAQMGYSPEAMFRSWRERGWLRVQGDRYTYRMRVRGLVQHMITLDWAAVTLAEAPISTTTI
jgi:putative DNA primase/helicase